MIGFSGVWGGGEGKRNHKRVWGGGMGGKIITPQIDKWREEQGGGGGFIFKMFHQILICS